MKLDKILWSTCGEAWGFRRLLEPQLKCNNWLSIYDSIFNRDSTDEEQFSRGQIQIDDKLMPYISVVFPDPKLRKDQAGRIIPHKIAIFGEESKDFNDIDSVKNSFWPELSDVYSQLYDYSIDQIANIEVIANSSSLTIREKHIILEEEREANKKNFSMAIPIIAVLLIALLIILLYQFRDKLHQTPQNKDEKTSIQIEELQPSEQIEIPIKLEDFQPSEATKSSILSKEETNLSADFQNKFVQ